MKKQLCLSLCLGVGLVGTTYAQIDSNQALKRLTVNAKQKVSQGGINLNSLLSNTSNDLIVEYKVDSNAVNNPQQLRQYVSQQKQRYQNNFKRLGGFELLRDYNALPISFHRVKNRDTLVELLNDPNVKAVYPNRVSQTATDKSYELIGQTTAAQRGFKADGTTVVVLDTGVNYRHADFGGCTAPGSSSSCRVSHSLEIAPEDYSLDSNGHGSNVSGIIAKVAPNTKIVTMDVFRGSSAYDSDLISALNWVTNNAKTLNIKSVNMSIGNKTRYTSTCQNSSLANSFNNLRKLGVSPVVSAGNDGYSNGISYPACTVGAVSVGAIYDSNIGGVSYSNCRDTSTFSDKVTCFSNSSSNLTLFAPGASMQAGGYNQSGTSQAAPHVAAAIAILGAPNAFPAESVDQTVQRLRTYGTLITDHRNNLRIPRLNILDSLQGASGTPSQPQPQPPVVEQPPVVTPTPTPAPTPAPTRQCRQVLFFTICSA